ncbi:MAG: hypothetical protein IJL49_05545 [Firmicutes bacterium]|nr:hypothetical protein [Bacillota bacterium]
MADNMNMELNDEMLADAAGGADGDIPAPRFKVGDIAVQTNGNFRVEILDVLKYHSKEWGWNYRVKYLNGGAETEFMFDKDLA